MATTFSENTAGDLAVLLHLARTPFGASRQALASAIPGAERALAALHHGGTEWATDTLLPPFVREHRGRWVLADSGTALLGRLGALAREVDPGRTLPGNRAVDALYTGAVCANTWTASAVEGLALPLGGTGETVRLGTGMTHHVLVAGQPGSGKTNLIHAVVSGLCEAYPPEELQLSLVDLKAGVGLLPYATHALPHARVVGVDGDPEFARSILDDAAKEIERRGTLFRRAGTAEYVDYRRATGETLPRWLVVVDEYQELFRGDGTEEREAHRLLDVLVRQGRGFGIHLLLASQTAVGGNALPSSTRDQFGVRIALQCSQAQGRALLGDSNNGAEQCDRPGKACVNTRNGDPAGNAYVQLPYVDPKDLAARIRSLRTHAEPGWPEPRCFDGGAPPPWPGGIPKVARLGESVLWHEDAVVELKAEEGASLLVVDADATVQRALVLAPLATWVQGDGATATVVVGGDDGAAWSSAIAALGIGDRVAVRGRGDAEAAVADAARRAESRAEGSQVLVLAGLGGLRSLRSDSLDGNPVNDRLGDLLRDGPENGVHLVVAVDSMAALMRVFSRRQLGAFGYRAAGPLPDNDAVALFERIPSFSRPGRMVLYDDRRPGTLIRFRPYAGVGETA
ncbi:MAG: FtsK/SpoIIIE domain-containing protein [Armatimonadota bacterium]